MKRPHLPEWLRKRLYEWSAHVKIEQEKRDWYRKGKAEGETHVPVPVYKTVIYTQSCTIHGVPLIEREGEPGTFDCPLCKQFSGPIQPYQPGAYARFWRDQHPTLKLHTNEMEAIRIKNYGGC